MQENREANRSIRSVCEGFLGYFGKIENQTRALRKEFTCGTVRWLWFGMSLAKKGAYARHL